jgi:ABC-type glycerol-3-phosphate transport system permease component/Pyruvate/2-oxoacid:ferredoxin oxidoreductase delta subunit
MQCNWCSYVCPHAVIRPFVRDAEEAEKFEGVAVPFKDDKSKFFAMGISALDCTGCGSCADVCPARNKALEMVEAKYLFARYNAKLDVLVHPQSAVHALIELTDGSLIAQCGYPDMKLPIAYALSRKTFRWRRAILVFLMIPMLFSGGLVSTYMVNTQILHLQNTYFALILPGLCSTWYIMILRNYIQMSVPDEMIEAAQIDGGGQLQIFCRIIVPVIRPVIMTVALFQIFAYWNSWYPSLLYLDSNHTSLYPIQYVLVNMQRSIDRLSKDTQYMSGMQTYLPPAVTVRMVLVVVAILPILVIFPFFQRYVKNGMTVGAVKG